jgi:hypothetical protein
MHRYLWAVFALAALGLGALGLYDLCGWLNRPPPAEYLTVTPEVCDLGEVAASGTVFAEFRLRNRWDQPVHILGWSLYSQTTAEMATEAAGTAIPPGEERSVQVQCRFTETGEQDGVLRLFTNCPGKTILPLQVRARVVSPPAPGGGTARPEVP